jgi:hypothetical protein
MNDLISRQRVIDEKLDWRDVTTVKDGTRHVDVHIIDAKGAIYHGVLEDDGTVSTGGDEYAMTFDSVQTYEGFSGAESTGISKRYGRGRTRHDLYHNSETGQVFDLVVHPNVSGDERLNVMDACDVLQWLVDIDNRDEPVRYDIEPRALAISLPIKIINAIERRLPSGHAIDWVRCILAEALGDIALAGPAVNSGGAGAPAFTPAQVREALAVLVKNDA